MKEGYLKMCMRNLEGNFLRKSGFKKKKKGELKRNKMVMFGYI